jgi:NDP-sugar pyrophosphorylase family protein
MNIVIPMLGLGLRFKDVGINTPKPLIDVNGKTLIEHSLSSLNIDGRYIFLTRDYEEDSFNKELTNILDRLAPGNIQIKIKDETRGAAESCLYALEFIDNDQPLIITNCDQIFDWDASSFINFVKDCDGAVAIHKSSDPKHSYVLIENEKITKIVEKKVISDDALIGLHYWKNGKDFVSSAKKLLTEYLSSGLKECYISSTYEYLIKDGKKIVPFYVPQNSYICLGTPHDVEIYLAKIKEYYSEKPKTIFCDIDGTILKHAHKFSHIGKEDPIDLPGVIDKFNDWDSKGYKIVLTTARKESARYITEKHLSELGFCWDYLLMGITSGTRFLLNDKLKSNDDDRAIAINLLTDSGFNNVDWRQYGL